jgi:hypothetical protein
LRHGRACDIYGTHTVRLAEKYFGFGRTSKVVLSTVLVLLMLALSALATCPALHHALHPDSDCHDHHCLVTVFASGQLSGVEVTSVIVFIAASLFCSLLLPAAPSRSLFDYCFAPSRAPPRS